MAEGYAPFEERVIWSPSHAGCLMIQRRYPIPSTAVAKAVGSAWVDWTSACEGEYPTLASAQAVNAVGKAMARLALWSVRGPA